MKHIKISDMFSYMYYKIYKVYTSSKYTSDIDHPPDAYAVGIITLMQFFNIFSILLFIDPVLKSINIRELLIIDNKTKIYFFVLYLILFLFNFFKFKNQYKKLSDKWSKEEAEDEHKSEFRGFLVILYIVLSFVIFLVSTSFTK